MGFQPLSISTNPGRAKLAQEILPHSGNHGHAHSSLGCRTPVQSAGLGLRKPLAVFHSQGYCLLEPLGTWISAFPVSSGWAEVFERPLSGLSNCLSRTEEIKGLQEVDTVVGTSSIAGSLAI